MLDNTSDNTEFENEAYLIKILFMLSIMLCNGANIREHIVLFVGGSMQKSVLYSL